MKARDNGRLGELKAARYLREKGYEIIQANYRTRYGEIDIIAADGTFIVFVEVKTRGRNAVCLPREAVTRAKRQRIIAAAGQYLSLNPSTLQPRFDVIEVTCADGFRAPTVNHIVNAFTL